MKEIRRGFTLIEIMLVVIIIGVLAAMVVPRLVGRTEQARVTVAKGDIESNLANALDLFEMDTGSYPEKLEDLTVNPGIGDRWKGPYLKKAPKDPWGRPYKYEPPKGAGEDYRLCSSGPDENNKEGEICNR